MLNPSDRLAFTATMIAIGQNYGIQLEAHMLEFMLKTLLVWDAIRRSGIYAHPTFEDPVTDQIVREMGWKSICATPENERSWFLRNVATAYKAHRKCDEVKAISGPTAVGGLIENMVKTIGMTSQPAMHG